MNLLYAPKSAKANRRHRQSLVVNPPVVFGQFKHWAYSERNVVDVR